LQRRGFTLIELLVVIAIIAVLIGLLLPAVQKVREAANRTQCSNNLKQIGLAMHNYESDRKRFPVGGLSAPLAPLGKASNASALVQLLPYLEQANLYNKADLNQSMQDPANDPSVTTQEIPIFLCPSDLNVGRIVNYGRCNYLASIGASATASNTDPSTGGAFHRPAFPATPPPPPGAAKGWRIADIIDGTSNTAAFSEVKRGPMHGTTPKDLMVYQIATIVDNAPTGCNVTSGTTFSYAGGEYFRAAVLWTAFYNHTVVPNDTTYNYCVDGSLLKGHMGARSYHPSGVNMVMCDGSVHFITNSISLVTWMAMGTRGGGEVFDLSQLQ
jgi:prepilin-type N-terminal cleavage/methylation domain-containing protein/prepilin-type processing-associated H-X9-DG protein